MRPLEPMQTVGDFRRNLVDGLGEWMVNRRFLQMVQKGTAPFQDAEVDKSPFLNACTYIEASASGAPDKWRPMMTSLLTELKRARQHGFRPEEFEQAKKDLLAGARQRALTESTRDSTGFLRQMNSLVSQGRKPISAQQSLELTQSLIGTVTLDEVDAAFRDNFDAGRPPAHRHHAREGGALPCRTKDDLLAVAKQVASAEVTPPEERKLPTSLLAQEPTPGAVTSSEEDEDLGVLSVTLDNGVRAHLRSMDFKKDQVFVRITLAGGTIRETAADRGVTNVAALAFSQPASDTLTSTDIEDLMTGKNVSFSGAAAPDAVTISVTSATKDIDDAFRLIHLMLTHPAHRALRPGALEAAGSRRPSTSSARTQPRRPASAWPSCSAATTRASAR